MRVLEDRFRLSNEEVSFGRFLASDKPRMESIAALRLGSYSSYWLEMLRTLPALGGEGLGETIAVVDSGFLESETASLKIDQSRSMDFTHEGLTDSLGHGTAISKLIHLVAPNATQVHLKIFNREGTIVGSDYGQRVALIKRAFEHLATLDVSMVSLSWNHLTFLGDHDPDPRPKHFCHCPVCKIVTDYVTASDVHVFISEGNWEFNGRRETRPQGSWSCPASAELAVPVVGYRDGKREYNNNLDTTSSISAPSQIGITMPRFKVLGELSKHVFPRIVVMSGSSFAVPLVTATYAAVRSAFKTCRYERFTLPRNSDAGSTSYDFPLELFFFPPDDLAEAQRGAHAEWAVLAHNWRTRSLQLAREGDYLNAGQLSCLAADLLFVAFKRMEGWRFNVGIAEFMIRFYLEGIHFLQRSEFAVIASDFIRKAQKSIELAHQRGHDTAEEMKVLEALKKYGRDHAIEFLLR